jgi:hypothetical protein
MSQVTDHPTSYTIHYRPKDIGVAVVVLVALALGWLLRMQVEERTVTYQEPDSPFRIAYPATWTSAESLQDVLLKVENPQTDSAFKTALTVERRDLDPTSPPTLQTLVDRRIVQRSALTAYYFLGDDEVTLDGARGARLQYAYVVQPIETPRRAALPVVVQASEYIVVAQDRTYYIALVAPEHEYAAARARFERLLQTVRVQ